MLGDLLDQIPQEEQIDSVYTDGAYDTKQCIKLLGDKLCSMNFDSQVNEIHARVAILNKFTELGRPHTQGMP